MIRRPPVGCKSGLCHSITSDDIEYEPVEGTVDKTNTMDAAATVTHVAPSSIEQTFPSTQNSERLSAEVQQQLRRAFKLQYLRPLSNWTLNHLLERPGSAHEWCLAVIEQRWYQFVGNRLQITPAEFHWYAKRGHDKVQGYMTSCKSTYEAANLIHPQKCSCIFDPTQFLLHRWGMEILQELESEMESTESNTLNENGTLGPHEHSLDGTWRYPKAIAPQIIRVLPLPVEARFKYYEKVCALWDEVPRDIRPVTQVYTVGRMKRQVPEYNRRVAHQNLYLGDLFHRFEHLSWQIAVEVKEFLTEHYNEELWSTIQRDYDEEMENERKEEEWRVEEARLNAEDKLQEDNDDTEEEENPWFDEDLKEVKKSSSEAEKSEESPEVDASHSGDQQTTLTRSTVGLSSFSAEELANLLKTPDTFNWADEFEDDDFESSTPPPTPMLHKVQVPAPSNTNESDSDEGEDDGLELKTSRIHPRSVSDQSLVTSPALFTELQTAQQELKAAHQEMCDSSEAENSSTRSGSDIFEEERDIGTEQSTSEKFPAVDLEAASTGNIDEQMESGQIPLDNDNVSLVDSETSDVDSLDVQISEHDFASERSISPEVPVSSSAVLLSIETCSEVREKTVNDERVSLANPESLWDALDVQIPEPDIDTDEFSSANFPMESHPATKQRQAICINIPSTKSHILYGVGLSQSGQQYLLQTPFGSSYLHDILCAQLRLSSVLSLSAYGCFDYFLS